MQYGDFYQNPARETSRGTTDASLSFPSDEVHHGHPLKWMFLLVFLLVILPGAGALYYYFGPSLRSLIKPEQRETRSIARVPLKMGSLVFSIPANYLRFRHLRKGGSIKQLDLFARWPGMRGFSPEYENDFLERGAASPVIIISLDQPDKLWSPEQQLKKLYPAYFSGPARPGPHGLEEHPVRPGSELDGQDIYSAETGSGVYLVRCLRNSNKVLPEECYRDLVYAGSYRLSYHFRRALLPEWRKLDRAVIKLFDDFRLGIRPSR